MERLEFKKILFIDIETAGFVADYTGMDKGMQAEWDRKAQYLKGFEDDMDNRNEKLFEQRAGIYAEFGRVVCICLGAIIPEGDSMQLVVKSLAGDDEKELLQEFIEALHTFVLERGSVIFCGHNIKEFDLPYLCRRLTIHQMPLPNSLQLSNKKPWEILHQDTLELWRFGDYKHFISLSLLAQCLGIPSPKDDLDGSMVHEVFWNERNLDRIATYCMKDVATTAKVFLRLKGINLDTLTIKYLSTTDNSRG